MSSKPKSPSRGVEERDVSPDPQHAATAPDSSPSHGPNGTEPGSPGPPSGSGGGGSGGSGRSKPHKSKRKISMPWFRQSSFGMSLARLRLPKQHTIATSDGPAGSPGKSAAEDEHAELKAKLVRVFLVSFVRRNK